MSDISYNTMRFLSDEFNPYIRQALLISNSPADLSTFNQLDQITVLGNEPSGSKRRFLFKMDDKVYKFSGQNAVEFTDEVNLSNVLSHGNTASELEAVRANRTLVGKKIFPIIALYSSTQDAPSAKIVFSASLVQEVLDHITERAPLTLRDELGNKINGTILGFTWDSEIVGNASCVFRFKLKKNGTWTDYLTPTEARGQTVEAIQVKWIFHVDAVDGINSVKMRRLKIHWSPDADSLVYGDYAYLVSNTKYCVRNLSGAVLVVRHEDLDGGSLEADVSYQITRVRKYSVSVGTIGAEETSLGLHQHVFPWSLKVYLNGVQTTDFTFDTNGAKDGTVITIPAKAGRGTTNVTVDYMYNRTDEVWQPMIRDLTQPTGDGNFATRFALPNSQFDSANLTTALIRIKLNRGYSSTTLQDTGMSKDKIVYLSHCPDDIECDAEDWLYDFDEKLGYWYVQFNAPVGNKVNINYSWTSKTPVILGWSVVYSA